MKIMCCVAHDGHHDAVVGSPSIKALRINIPFFIICIMPNITQDEYTRRVRPEFAPDLHRSEHNSKLVQILF